MSDRCAVCFNELEPAPLGGHFACPEHPNQGYWSPCGNPDDKARLVSKHGRPTLYYYGGSRWFVELT